MRRQTYHNYVKLFSVQFAGLAFQLAAHGAHLLGRYALVGHTSVEQIDHALTDVYADNALDVWREFARDSS